MEVVSGWKESPLSSCSFELAFACHPSDDKSRGSLETYTILLERSNDTFQWKVDANELEAILGLWTFWLLKSDAKWSQNSLGRAVGLTKDEAGAEATDLYYHKWIFRQREAMMVSSKMISFPEQTFGYFSGDYPDSREILVVKTENSLGAMAAQDIYIQFLMVILAGTKSDIGDVDILPISQTSFLAQSTCLDELVACFETGNLGSREDALLCIVPVLRHHRILPELAGDTSRIRERIQKLTSDGNWDDAFSTLQWLCQRSEGDEFQRSVYELGLLCQRAMLINTASVRDKGFEIVKSLLKCDTRFEFFNSLRSRRPSDWMASHGHREWWAKFSSQLGWAAWHIANRLNRQAMKAFLESIGLSDNSVLQTNSIPVDCTGPGMAQLMVLASLDPEFVVELPGDYQCEDDLYLAECLNWVNSNKQTALCHWLLARWAEYGKQSPHQAMKGFVRAAQSDSELAVSTLCRQGADINAIGNDGCTALMVLVSTADIEATRKLLVHGADVNACSSVNRLSSLGFAAIQGHEDILSLLLDYGADLELRDRFGHSALQSACAENHVACAALLLDRGANIEAIATDGRTPLILATVGGYLDIVRLLIERGANINATDSEDSTALMQAVTIRSEELVRFLLDMQADKERRDYMGRTALDIANERGYASIAAILMAA
jgi:ankyrin repeat protein